MTDARAGSIAELLRNARPRSDVRLRGLVERLAALPGGVATAGSPDAPMRGVSADSRDVADGFVFVAIRGERADGHDFVPAAIHQGAAAIVVERRLPDVDVPQLVVTSSRRALAEAAAWWFDDPSQRLGVIGITGTDGKTTTSLLAAAALAAADVPAGLVGTVATQIGGVREMNAMHSTTPEAPAIQRALRAMVDAGDRAAILETTSHGLAMDRVAAVDYDIAILTNLTHEHLDLHGSFEAYRDAKLSLFERLEVTPAHPAKTGAGWPRTGIVNADDPSADMFVEATRSGGARVLTYSANPGRRRADVVSRSNVVDRPGHGIRLSYDGPSGSGVVRSPLSGGFNINNLLAVLALGEALGLDAAAVRHGLESVAAIPGRMERIVAGQPFEVMVDYAHTPASLRTVLSELRRHARASGGGLIAVFGSAGERDTQKRSDMGQIAGQMCRIVVLTDEDPRGEARDAILAEIAAGATGAGKERGRDLFLIPDRRAAIREAMARARAGDIVILAGKGHETTIEYADHALPWNERAEAERALAELGFRS